MIIYLLQKMATTSDNIISDLFLSTNNNSRNGAEPNVETITKLTRQNHEVRSASLNEANIDLFIDGDAQGNSQRVVRNVPLKEKTVKETPKVRNSDCFFMLYCKVVVAVSYHTVVDFTYLVLLPFWS